MLVLTHKQGDKVYIEYQDVTIVIEFKDMKNGQIRALYDAPKKVKIDRANIYFSKKQFATMEEKQKAIEANAQLVLGQEQAVLDKTTEQIPCAQDDLHC